MNYACRMFAKQFFGKAGAHGLSLLIPLTIGMGCAGDLEDPERFMPGGGDLDCATVDVEQLLVDSCGSGFCHDAEDPSANLDLASAGVASRLINIASGCSERILFDPLDPPGSFMSEKLLSDTPECGSRMPLGGDVLTAGEVTCVEQWLGEQTP